MPFVLNRIGQIAVAVRDVVRAEEFYRDALGLRKLYRYGELSFLTAPAFACFLRRHVIRTTSSPARRSTLPASTQHWQFGNCSSEA